MRVLDRRALILGLLGLFASVTSAQDGEPVVITAQGTQYGFTDENDPDRIIWVFLDGVEVVQGGRRMLGERLVVVLRRDAATPPTTSGESAGLVLPGSRVMELFLDGDATFEEGEELVVGASSVHVDNAAGTVTVLEGAWHSSLGQSPLIVRFGVMRMLSDGVREIEALTYTTCEYAHAHWGVDTPWARLVPTADGRVLHTGGNTLYAGAMPVFWFPGLHYNVDRDRPPLRSVGFGSSGRFGTQIETEWGADASDALTSLADALDLDGPVEGDWALVLNGYTKRGLFIEPALSYRTPSSFGKVFGASINDTARTDELDQPITDHTRGRFDIAHRTRLDETRTVDVEVSYLSDRNFLEEYYESEAKTGKEQETYAFYKEVDGDTVNSVLARARLNDFQTQVEYLPRVEQRRAGTQVDMGFLGQPFWTARHFADNARLAAEEVPPATPGGVEPTQPRSSRNLRAGTTGQLTWPFDVGGDRVQVMAGYDMTGFENDLRAPDDPTTPAVDEQVIDEGGRVRYAITGGAAWSRTYSAVTDTTSETWNLDGVRHLVEPMAGYGGVLELNAPPEELVVIDGTETLRKAQAFEIGLRHRVQTHQDDEVVTVLDTDVSVPLFPNEDRDNAGRTGGIMTVDTEWTPGAHIWGLREAVVRWRADIDPNGWEYVTSFFSYSTALGPDRRFELSHNKAVHTSDFLGAGIEWVLTPKWSAAVFVQQDLRLNENARRGLLLRQKAHRWLIDIEISRRRGRSRVGPSRDRDETSITIQFRPAIFSGGETLLSQLGRIR